MRRYLEELIRGEFPARHGVRVRNVAEIEEGWERSIYAFDLSDEGTESEPLVARFYQGPNGGRRAAWEAAVLRAVARAGVPVPRVELASADGSQYGTAVVVMERIHGLPLAAALAGSPSLAVAMARALAALHRIPVESVFDDSLRPFTEPEFIAPDVKTMTAAVDRYELVEFGPLIERLHASAPADDRPCVLHNDYTPENIVVGEDGSLAILDWSFAGVGDYRLDVAWSALWTEARAGSGPRAEFLGAYEETVGHPLESIEYYEALRLGARLMTIVAWLDDAIEFPAIKVTKDVIYGDYKPTVAAVYERFRDVTGVRLTRIEQL